MSTTELMRRVTALHARGDLPAAHAAGEAALATNADPALQHLVGVIACQIGDPARGAALLRQAYQATPVPAIGLNLARALLDTGALEEAAALCEAAGRSMAVANDFTRLHADILGRQGRPAEAAGKYRLIVAAQPRDAQLWNNFGNALHDSGETTEAIAALTLARDLARKEPIILVNLARALTTAKRYDDALARLEDARHLAPADATIMVEQARLLNRMGRSAEALPLLGSAARLRRDDPEIIVLVGLAYSQSGQFDRAELAYGMALRIAPANVDALLNLGILFEQSNRIDAIAALLRDAEAVGADMAQLGYLRALVHRSAGQFAPALAALQSSTGEVVDDSLRAQLAGQLLDRLGDYPAAFRAFTEMNDAVAGQPLAARLSPDAYRHSIEASTASTTQHWVDGWSRSAVPGGRPAPVFLVGFPRSGTTLLDTILMGHAETVVLEEEPVLQRVQEHLPGMAALSDLDAGSIAMLRARYFVELDKIEPDVGDRLVIDKLPLNLLRTPLIHRIFPEARFIFAKRHPADVTLSCFMQNFKVNQAMASFLTLDSTARLYDAVMTFWMQCRSVFDLDVHDIAYEDMVVDLEGELRPLLAFLGLPWSDAVLDHQRTAAGRGLIRTPSYAQVSEKIYARSSGRWTHYHAQLDPILPILAPWVERFGYPPIQAADSIVTP